MTFATLDGEPLVSATVLVPQYGAWFADVVLEGAADLSGAVVLKIGDLELSGTIDPTRVGSRGDQTMARVLAGGGGWGKPCASKHYAADNGVRALQVATDAAREAGEELGTFSPVNETLGTAFVRRVGPCFRALEQAAGGRRWWVGYDGKTNVGERESTTPTAYEVLAEDPAAGVVILGVDDPSDVQIGAVLTEGLDEAQTVRELEIQLKTGSLRVRVWTGGGESASSELADAFSTLVRRSLPDALHGVWRYRVVQMNGERVELQIVEKASGLPNVLPVSQFPGIAGAHAELTPGAHVLVQFIGGKVTEPVVTHFEGRGGDGHTPVKLVLGGPSGKAAAGRVGDAVQVTIPIGTVVVVPGGGSSGSPGQLNATEIVVDGEITAGSSIVEVGG
jgi:hypothetical protein